MDKHEDESRSIKAYEFWRTTLRSARYVVAPMVDQSELAWRLLSRRHGAQLCYTPMYHSSVFVRDANYRKEALASCDEDRPLIVQFCGNDPDLFLKAALLAEDHCDAIDLNLGCPQVIAKRGHYGAYLQDEWELIYRIVKLCHQKLKVPITCKTRVFSEIDKTVRYAQMLEKAGCQLLSVHARTKEQKGPLTGVASWEHIKAVRENVNIPVFANGNIQYMPDVERCLKVTGAEGVMTAEGNLHNPALFEGNSPLTWDVAEQYLTLVDQYPCPLSYVRGHLFKIFQHLLQVHKDLREILAKAKTLKTMKALVTKIKTHCQPFVEENKVNPESYKTDLPVPYWACQPYVRLSPEEYQRKNLVFKAIEDRKRQCDDTDDHITLSSNKQKRIAKNPTKTFKPKGKKYEICTGCPNPKGLKCDYSLCKICCKAKTKAEVLDCIGHDFMRKSKPYLNRKRDDRETPQKT